MADIPQGTFDFFGEVEKVGPPPKPKRQPLRPPEQIEISLAPVPPAPTPENITAPPPPAPVASEKIVAAIPAETAPVTEEKIIAEETTETAVPEPPLNTENKTGGRGRKSYKEMDAAAGDVAMPDEATLNQKHYYSMGEVTAMLKENHSLIRYWEAEFDILKPKKNGKGDRFFRPVDVKNLYLIYDLLRRRKFTIEGAKDYLKKNKNAEAKFAAIQSLQEIKAFLTGLRA